MHGTAHSLAETSARRHSRPALDGPRAQAPDVGGRFEYLLPVTKQWFRLGEVAVVIGMSESFVEALYDQGRIFGHEFNAGTGQRMAKRVPRAFVVTLLTKSARYESEAKLQAFLGCLCEFSAAELHQVATAANCLAGRKAATGLQGGKMMGLPSAER